MYIGNKHTKLPIAQQSWSVQTTAAGFRLHCSTIIGHVQSMHCLRPTSRMIDSTIHDETYVSNLCLTAVFMSAIQSWRQTTVL